MVIIFVSGDRNSARNDVAVQVRNVRECATVTVRNSKRVRNRIERRVATAVRVNSGELAIVSKEHGLIGKV